MLKSEEKISKEKNDIEMAHTSYLSLIFRYKIKTTLFI